MVQGDAIERENKRNSKDPRFAPPPGLGNLYKTGGLHSTEIAYLLLTQQPRVRFSAFARIFCSLEVAEIA